MSGIRPFYSVTRKQTIVRAHIVRAQLVRSESVSSSRTAEQTCSRVLSISDDSEVLRVTWMYILHRQYNRSCFVVLST